MQDPPIDETGHKGEELDFDLIAHWRAYIKTHLSAIHGSTGEVADGFQAGYRAGYRDAMCEGIEDE